MKGAEKFVKKKRKKNKNLFVRNLYPYYFIHGKVVTDSGKVLYTATIISTH